MKEGTELDATALGRLQFQCRSDRQGHVADRGSVLGPVPGLALEPVDQARDPRLTSIVAGALSSRSLAATAFIVRVPRSVDERRLLRGEGPILVCPARESGVVGSPGLLLLGALLALLIAAWVVAVAVCSGDLDRADSRLANDFRDRSEL